MFQNKNSDFELYTAIVEYLNLNINRFDIVNFFQLIEFLENSIHSSLHPQKNPTRGLPPQNSSHNNQQIIKIQIYKCLGLIDPEKFSNFATSNPELPQYILNQFDSLLDTDNIDLLKEVIITLVFLGQRKVINGIQS